MVVKETAYFSAWKSHYIYTNQETYPFCQGQIKEFWIEREREGGCVQNFYSENTEIYIYIITQTSFKIFQDK